MTRILTLTASAIIIFAGTGAALASPGDRLERMMTALDTDQSGTISFEEFTTRGDERFSMMDADGDGAITQEERQAAREAVKERFGGKAGKKKNRPRGRLERVDADEDGVITRAEHDAAQRAHFASLDVDGDGAVTADEVEARAKERRGKGKRRP